MNITDILKNEEMNDEDKLSSIITIVTKVRKAYGNEDTVITVPELYTPDGLVSLCHVPTEHKLAYIEREIAEIKTSAIEHSNDREGVNINKTIEESIATSPFLTNLGEVQTFDYI